MTCLVLRAVASLLLTAPASAQDAAEAQPVVTPPRLLEFVEAEYPDAAREAGLEAAVELEITIMADGNVMEVQVVGPAGHGFDEAAVDAANRFVFEPATRDGAPVPARIRYRYVFELREAALEPEPEEPEIVPGRLEGRVLGREDAEPVPGAEVIVVNDDGSVARRAVTGDRGVFRFDDLPPDRYELRIIVAEYGDFQASEVVVSGEATEVTYRIELLSDPEEFGAVAVVDAPPREAVRRTITREELTRVPGTRGDALRTVELLPGVGRPQFGSGQLIVRGSAPQDSQVFLDATPVPLLYHFGGLTSFYNSRMLDRIDFYPGNFSARFGRKLGGILDVGARDPARDGPHAVADLNVPLDASLLVEAPLGDDLSVGLAGRRSYIDFFFENLVPESAFDVVAAPVYYDYQLVGAWRPTARDRVRLSLYGSSDEFRIVLADPADGDAAIRGSFDLATSFHKLYARWTRQLSDDVDQELQIAAGPTRLDFALGEDLLFDATFWTIDMRAEWRARLSSRVRVIAGMDIDVTPFDVAFRGPPLQQGEGNPGGNSLSQMEIEDVSLTGVAYRPAAYVESDMRVLRQLQLILGLRLDWYREIEKWSFDPRAVAIYSVDDENRIKIAGGIFSQPPDFAESSEDLGNPSLSPTRALHLGVGYERDLAPGISVGTELFYKHLWDRVVQTFGTLGERFNNDGIGRIYGVELSGRVQPYERRWFGFLSYTLSRSERRDRPEDPWRLFDFDQTHILSVAAVYRLGRGWEVGGTFRLVSGNPSTPVVGGVHESLYSDTYSPIYGPVNSRRNPFFHRLDVRVEKLWTFDDWKLALYLDVQNVYNATNSEGTIYNADFTESTELPGLPIIPVLGVRGEL